MPKFKINNEEFIFIHIPKTGGSSIEVWLQEFGEMSFYSTVVPTFLKCSPQHFTYSYFEFLEPKLKLPAFAIVRNPYDRAESEYFYRTKNAKLVSRPNFSFWLLRHLQHLDRNPHHLDNHFLPQSYFVEGGVKIYQFEDGLPKIIAQIGEDYNVPIPDPLPHRNKSVRSEVKWSTELLVKFNKYYKADFEILGYPMRKPMN